MGSSLEEVRAALERTKQVCERAPASDPVPPLESLKAGVSKQRRLLLQQLSVDAGVSEHSMLRTVLSVGTHDLRSVGNGSQRLRTKEDFVSGLAFGWTPPPPLAASIEVWGRSNDAVPQQEADGASLPQMSALVLPPSDGCQAHQEASTYQLTDLLGNTLSPQQHGDPLEGLSEEASLFHSTDHHTRISSVSSPIGMDAVHNYLVGSSLDALVQDYLDAEGLLRGPCPAPTSLKDFASVGTRDALRGCLARRKDTELLQWIGGLAGLVGGADADTPISTYVGTVEMVVDSALTAPTLPYRPAETPQGWGDRIRTVHWELSALEGELTELFVDAVVHLLNQATVEVESESTFSGLSAYVRLLLSIPGRKRRRDTPGLELLTAIERLRYIWSNLIPCPEAADFDGYIVRKAVTDVVGELGCGADRLDELVELSLTSVSGSVRTSTPTTAPPFLPLPALRLSLLSVMSSEGMCDDAPMSTPAILTLAAQVPWVLPHLAAKTAKEAHALLLMCATEVPVFRYAEWIHHSCLHAQLVRAVGVEGVNVPPPSVLEETLYPLSHQLLRHLASKEKQGLLGGNGQWRVINNVSRFIESTTLRSIELPESVNRLAMCRLFGGRDPRLPSYYYCPINKVRCTPLDLCSSTHGDPPCMLSCGHVVSKQFCLSSTNHSAARRAPIGAVRCPYCRMTTTDSKVLPIAL